MKQPLHKLIDTRTAVRALRPDYCNCPGCGTSLALALRRGFLIGEDIQCWACGLEFSWTFGTPWIHRSHVKPEQAAAFLLASKLTDDKEALAQAAGVPVASVRLWLRDQTAGG